MHMLLTLFLNAICVEKCIYTHAAIVDPNYYNGYFGDLLHHKDGSEIEKRASGHDHVNHCGHQLTCPESHYHGHGSVDSLLAHCAGAHERVTECHVGHHLHHGDHEYGDDYGDDECDGDSDYGYRRKRRDVNDGSDVIISEAESNRFFKNSERNYEH